MNKKSGFTITELMFAMAFVAALLIVLLASIIQITRTYNKGVTLKRVNQSGRTLGAELQRTLRQADPNSINASRQSAGRLCLGGYSFVWNMPAAGEAPATENRYEGPAPNNTLVGFARVRDPGATMCPSTGLPPVPRNQDTKELIGDGLVMRQPTAYSYITGDGTGALINMQYTISTPTEGIIENDRCAGASGDDFCALNTFNVTVYAKGN